MVLLKIYMVSLWGIEAVRCWQHRAVFQIVVANFRAVMYNILIRTAGR